MRTYEAIYILDPALDEAQQGSMVQRFETLVQNQGGTVLHIDRWERRRLAYEVKGRREGYYVVMNFRGEPAAEAELGRVFRITDGVLRHMIVLMDERKAERAIAEARAAAEAKARAAAEAAAAEAEAAAAAEAEAAEAEAARAEAARAEAARAEAARAEAAEAQPAQEESQPTGEVETGSGSEEAG